MTVDGGPVCVVTGSTRGIGLGLARELAGLGARVVVCGRSAEGVERALGALALGDRAVGTTCDVTDETSVQALWDFAVEAFDRVDVWINNAGSTTVPLPLWQLDDDEVVRTIDTNLVGTLAGCRVAARGMLAQTDGGRIFNVEGLGSKGETQVGLTTYGVTKSAVTYLSKGLVKELAGTDVAVCTVRPGINVTEHLLHGAEVLDPKRWKQTKKVFNILGDTPETTTPWLARKILETTKAGTRISWLGPAKISWRFATSWANKRDLFAGMPDPHAGR